MTTWIGSIIWKKKQQRQKFGNKSVQICKNNFFNKVENFLNKITFIWSKKNQNKSENSNFNMYMYKNSSNDYAIDTIFDKNQSNKLDEKNLGMIISNLNIIKI